jgi:hypothetical protein
LQYGKTAKFYVYSPGEIDLNALIGRCKEMPRKRGPEGKPKHYAVPPEQLVKQEHFVHSNPPKGLILFFLFRCGDVFHFLQFYSTVKKTNI